MSQAEILFATDEHPGAVGGYELQVARLPNGSIESIAFVDRENDDIVEMPLEVALLFARMLNSTFGAQSPTTH